MTIAYTTKEDEAITMACFTHSDGSVFEVPISGLSTEEEIQTKLQDALDFVVSLSQ